MSMGNVRGGQISAGDKKKIAELRKRQKSSAVYRSGQRLQGEELDKYRSGIERQIANIQTRGGSEAYSVRPRFFGRPTRDIRTPSVTDTNINELLRANVGQPSRLPTPAAAPITPPPGATRLPGGLFMSEAPAPRTDTSPIIDRTPIVRETLPPIGATRLPGGLFMTPTTTENPYLSGQRTFTPPDTKFGFNFSLPTTTPTPRMGGRSFTSPYVSPRGIGMGTVGGFGRGLLSQLSSSGAGYTPYVQPTFDVGVAPFRNPKYTETLQQKLGEAMQTRPYLNAQLDPTLPSSKADIFGVNLAARATGREFDIFGNPRTIPSSEIEPRFGSQIKEALGGYRYRLY